MKVADQRAKRLEPERQGGQFRQDAELFALLPPSQKRDGHGMLKGIGAAGSQRAAPKSAWRNFYEHKDRYMTLMRPAYALTVHASQGSTFKHVGVDFDNIYSSHLAIGCALLRAKRREIHWLNSRNRLLYTAVTRGKEEVLIADEYALQRSMSQSV